MFANETSLLRTIVQSFFFVINIIQNVFISSVLHNGITIHYMCTRVGHIVKDKLKQNNEKKKKRKFIDRRRKCRIVLASYCGICV